MKYLTMLIEAYIKAQGYDIKTVMENCSCKQRTSSGCDWCGRTGVVKGEVKVTKKVSDASSIAAYDALIENSKHTLSLHVDGGQTIKGGTTFNIWKKDHSYFVEGIGFLKCTTRYFKSIDEAFGDIKLLTGASDE